MDAVSGVSYEYPLASLRPKTRFKYQLEGTLRSGPHTIRSRLDVLDGWSVGRGASILLARRLHARNKQGQTKSGKWRLPNPGPRGLYRLHEAQQQFAMRPRSQVAFDRPRRGWLACVISQASNQRYTFLSAILLPELSTPTVSRLFVSSGR